MAKKVKEPSILDCLKAEGIDRRYVAAKLKEVFEKGKGKILIDASKLYLLLAGDIKDEKGTAIFNSGPVMVISGASKDRIRALREGPVLEHNPPGLTSGVN